MRQHALQCSDEQDDPETGHSSSYDHSYTFAFPIQSHPFVEENIINLMRRCEEDDHGMLCSENAPGSRWGTSTPSYQLKFIVCSSTSPLGCRNHHQMWHHKCYRLLHSSGKSSNSETRTKQGQKRFHVHQEKWAQDLLKLTTVNLEKQIHSGTRLESSYKIGHSRKTKTSFLKHTTQFVALCCWKQP